MCGIFGMFNSEGSALNIRELHTATTTLRHRGPDDEGYLLANTRSKATKLFGGLDSNKSLNLPALSSDYEGQWNLAFGYRRLAILDLSPSGHQPMSNNAQNIWMIFNGEIFNYLELREKLIAKGYTFTSTGDSAVLLAAYEEWGEACTNYLVGMWAFAILDFRNSTTPKLFLSRDPFGIKPLYYTQINKTFAFASEIKALQTLSGVSRSADPQRLHDYLALGLTDHDYRTFFTHIYQLQPAHSLSISVNDKYISQICPKQYWQLDLSRKLNISLVQATEQVRDLFIKNIRLHMRSDVPVGAALSGGIDSSAIVSLMRKVEPEFDFHTFSYIANESAINEEKWADIVAQQSRSISHKINLSQTTLLKDIDQFLSAQDEPVSSTSVYAEYGIFQHAHDEKMIVMLNGQGADELLAGYPSYRAPRFWSMLARGNLIEAFQFHSWNPRKIMGGIISPALERLHPNSISQLGVNWAWFTDRQIQPLNLRLKIERNAFQHSLQSLLTSLNLPAQLRYSDRNSMAHSIESRVPFLTTEFAELVFALPDKYLLSENGEAKSVFRKAMRGLVPDAVLDRHNKIGFATPEKQWLGAMQDWVNKILQSDTAHRVSPLNLNQITAHWNAVMIGKAKFDWRLWRWINVIAWADQSNVSFK